MTSLQSSKVIYLMAFRLYFPYIFIDMVYQLGDANDSFQIIDDYSANIDFS